MLNLQFSIGAFSFLFSSTSSSVRKEEIKGIREGTGTATNNSEEFGLVVNPSGTASVLSRSSQIKLVSDERGVEVLGQSLCFVPKGRCRGVVKDEQLRCRPYLDSFMP